LRIERKPTDHQDAFTRDERKALSVRAVNQLIANVEAGRLLKNKELAEVIASCIRHTDQGDLQTSKLILDRHELEGIARWDKAKKAKGRE
jgi:hypothetical protein